MNINIRRAYRHRGFEISLIPANFDISPYVLQMYFRL